MMPNILIKGHFVSYMYLTDTHSYRQNTHRPTHRGPNVIQLMRQSQSLCFWYRFIQVCKIF